MPWPHDLRTPTSPFSPEPVGVCQRCHFKYPLSQLTWQHDWRGNSLPNLWLRVCPRDLDEPFQHNRPIIITGVEGYVPDARPPNYEANAEGGPYGPVMPSGPGDQQPFIDERDDIQS